MLKINYQHFLMSLIFIVLSCFVTSCDDQPSLQELRQHIANLQQKFFIFKKNKSLEITIPQPEVYQGTAEREPFDALDNAQLSGSLLSRYPLEQLKLLATLNTTSPPWAFVLAPNKKIYQVTVGEVVGNHQGKIIKISTDAIEIAESSEDGDKIVSLQLANINSSGNLH